MNETNLDFPETDEHVEYDVTRDNIWIVKPSSHVMQMFGQFVARIRFTIFTQISQKLFFQMDPEIK